MLRIILTVFALSLAASPQLFADVKVAFAPSPDVSTAIESAFDEAKVSIDAAIYSFGDHQLRARLMSACDRGVNVRLMLHNATDSKFAEDLETAGIDVRYVKPMMHHKFAVIDGPHAEGDDAAKAKVLTGSMNWARIPAARYDEDVLTITNNAAVATAYQHEFNQLWGHSVDFGVEIHGPTVEVKPAEPTVWFTSQNMKQITYQNEPTFIPEKVLDDGVCGQRIIEAIKSAKKTIKVATTQFRRRDIAIALQAAIERKVKVQLLLDGYEYGLPRTKVRAAGYDERLADTGAGVRYKISSPYSNPAASMQMHCKYMIVDDERVLTGSFNWTGISELKSFENLILVADKEAVAAYVRRFAEMWEYGKGEWEPLVARVKEQEGQGPCSFPPISLTGNQIESLRREYVGWACRD